jgi:N-dimethylarginine dimethylaminohydrolase
MEHEATIRDSIGRLMIRQSKDFIKNMEDYGVEVEYLKLDEIAEGDGLVHCMTQVIGRN